MNVLLALLIGVAAGVVLGRMLVRRDEAALTASFEGIAARALRGESQRDLAQQQQSVRQLVEPLREQLGRVEGQLRGLETERARAFGELSKQVDTVRQSSELLGRETASLVNALRKPQARGQWGEMQLRRVVEHAGMLERCDFDEQTTVRDADGRALRLTSSSASPESVPSSSTRRSPSPPTSRPPSPRTRRSASSG
ncbi:MAG: recombination protein RmuC [Actinomycetota bacterium]|jgi:DNA anti-recombination protein RmuC|nr:recombination protein RmuC [Actinomycetota bacterium]